MESVTSMDGVAAAIRENREYERIQLLRRRAFILLLWASLIASSFFIGLEKWTGYSLQRVALLGYLFIGLAMVFLLILFILRKKWVTLWDDEGVSSFWVSKRPSRAVIIILAATVAASFAMLALGDPQSIEIMIRLLGPVTWTIILLGLSARTRDTQLRWLTIATLCVAIPVSLWIDAAYAGWTNLHLGTAVFALMLFLLGTYRLVAPPGWLAR